jgi:hypothetical protein
MRWIVAGWVWLAAAGAAAQDGDDVDAQLVIDVSTAGDQADGSLVGSMHGGRLGPRMRRSYVERLPAGKCYLFVAHGGAGIENIDVAASHAGTVLTRDSDTGPVASVRHCTGESRQILRWTVSSFRGAGTFAAGVYEVPEVALGAAATGTGEGTVLERLEALARAHAADMGVVTTPRRETLAEGARIERNVTLAPGRCYRVLAAGEDTIADLDVVLLDPDGGSLQGDVGESSSAHLGVLRPLCPARPGAYRVAARAESGGGSFAWQIFGSVAGRREAAAQTQRASRFRVGGSGSGFVAARLRERHRAVGRGGSPVTDLLAGTLRTGDERSIALPVVGGGCYVALAAGMPSVRELDLRVRDPFGNERARDEARDAFPATGRFCASVSGRWTIEVRMFNGYGQYGLQVFQVR